MNQGKWTYVVLDAYNKISLWDGGRWVGMASSVVELFGRQGDVTDPAGKQPAGSSASRGGRPPGLPPRPAESAITDPAGLTFVVHFNDNPADCPNGNNYFAGWDRNTNAFVKFNNSNAPTQVVSWVACDHQGQPSAAVVDPEGNLSVWDGSQWQGLASGVNEQRPNSGGLIGSPVYRPKLAIPASPIGMTFVVRQDLDRFAGWNGSRPVKFSLDHSNIPTRVTAWVACDYQGQPSVAVMVTPADANGAPLCYVWDPRATPTGPDAGGSGNWTSLATGIVQLFGSQTFQNGLTFVVRVNDDPVNYKGNDYFAGWDGDSFVKFNNSDAHPTRVLSWEPADPNHPTPNAPTEPLTPKPLQKITTGDGSYVWTGTQWAPVP
jgi:hypothetical protein